MQRTLNSIRRLHILTSQLFREDESCLSIETLSHLSSSNPIPCSKQIRQYAECKHFAALKYIYCGSTDHDDEEEKNKVCYENQPRKTKNKRTVVTSIDKQGSPLVQGNVPT